MHHEIDTIDRKILSELDWNGRQTIKEIGRKIRKSKQFAEYRIKKLESAGIIKKYVAVIDYSKLGFTSIRIYLRLHNITPQRQQEIEDEIIKDKEVWWFASFDGPWDIGYAMAIQNLLDFYPYWDKLSKRFRKYIKEFFIVPYSHIRQYPKKYLSNILDNSFETLVGASRDSVSYDSIDLQLLHVLSDNGRISFLELAKRTNLNPQTVRRRLDRLTKEGVLLGYRAILDLTLLEYRYYKAYLWFNHTDRMQELEEYCRINPNILNTNRTIGGYDFEIEIQAKSFEEFESILNAVRERFDGMVNDYDFVIVRSEKKIEYFPFV